MYYTENYGTSINEGKKRGRLPKTKKLWLIMEKTMEIYENNWSFEQIYSFRILIYYGKNYGTIPKTMELWFTMEKNYDTMEKTMVL